MGISRSFATITPAQTLPIFGLNSLDVFHGVTTETCNLIPKSQADIENNRDKNQSQCQAKIKEHGTISPAARAS
jgi:hypothetical protein